MENCKILEILIAEDDNGHAELIQHGLRKSGVENEIRHFINGQEIWQFLRTGAPYSEIAYLLLLDINMPLLNGIEVLQLIKQDKRLKKIPVIMLTTTDDPGEVKKCYELGCSVYITKPVNFQEFSEKLNRLGQFIQIVTV
jgi:CheY-like chemotaxis protein